MPSNPFRLTLLPEIVLPLQWFCAMPIWPLLLACSKQSNETHSLQMHGTMKEISLAIAIIVWHVSIVAPQ